MLLIMLLIMGLPSCTVFSTSMEYLHCPRVVQRLAAHMPAF